MATFRVEWAISLDIKAKNQAAVENLIDEWTIFDVLDQYGVNISKATITEEPLKVGDKVRLLISGSSYVDTSNEGLDCDLEYREVPSGAIWTIISIDAYPAPQNLTYTLEAPNGVIAVIDDTDKIRGQYPWEVLD
jgi:hypothetical protein